MGYIRNPATPCSTTRLIQTAATVNYVTKEEMIHFTSRESGDGHKLVHCELHVYAVSFCSLANTKNTVSVCCLCSIAVSCMLLFV